MSNSPTGAGAWTQAVVGLRGWFGRKSAQLKEWLRKVIDSVRQGLAKEPLAQRTRKGLRTVLDYYFRYLVVVALFVLAVWLLLKVVAFLVATISPDRQLSFVPYDAADVPSKNATQVLSSKLRQLQSARQGVSGYGFLETPALASVPQEVREHAWQNLDTLKDINIKIKEVDVNALVKTLREVLSPDKYELRVRVVELDYATEVSSDLVYGDRQKGHWSSRGRKAKGMAEGAGGDAADAARDDTSATRDKDSDVNTLLDNVLFQMIYDLMTKDEFKEWGVRMNEHKYRPKNWQTLQAYTRGVQSLMAYQQNLDHRDLEEALASLKRLPVVAPDNPYGLYFYGIALSEDRDEDRAVTVFEQLQRLVSKSPPPAAPAGAPAAPAQAPAEPVPTEGYERMYYEAVFNEATARLKLYDEASAERAAATLRRLAETVRTRRDADAGENPAGDRCYYSKLLAISHAQLAYTHGTLLAILHRDEPQWPLEGQLRAHYDGVEERSRLAAAESEALRGCLTSPDPEEQAQLEREGKDILFRVRNARGYSRFRQAQYLTDDAEFVARCQVALRELEEANQARPNHYEVLQNMAIIYGDDRFNRDGTYLDQAESLYLLTKEFVPNDYFQYESLAQIQWRRMELGGPTDAAAIKKGKDFALAALERRAHSSRARYLLARFSEKAWENVKAGQTPETQGAAAAEAVFNFRQAIALRPHSTEFKTDFHQFLLRFADPATKDARIAFDAGSLLIQVSKKEFAADAEGRKRLLTRAGEMLTRAVALSDAKDTEDKKQINEESIKLQVEAALLLGTP